MAEILGIQILGALFGLVMIYFSFLYYKRNEYNTPTFVFWAVLWVVFIFVSVSPEFLDPLVTRLKVLRTMDLLVILGLMFATGLSYYNYVVVKRNECRVEKIVRTIALKKNKRK